MCKRALDSAQALARYGNNRVKKKGMKEDMRDIKVASNPAGKS